ncbi:MAG: 3'-5' exonuclease [Burkholderiaceae bacterium]|nr:3'-5' exonuclease [Burkholderiaceae bacterium]
MSPVLVFDIETIPDVAGLRRLGEVSPTVSDDTVVENAMAARKEKTGSDFLPLHQHRIVAIACLLRDDSGLTVRCLGQPDDAEAKLLGLFYRQVERYTPQLVSWNGGGFDLQVMHYRSLIHGVSAPRYWEQGDDDREFRWNNYLSRYHSRHLDLMDVLALYAPRASVPLDELAKLCGFPGKLGMDGSQVWSAYRAGGLDDIRAYCETDVANTYLMYCRFEAMRGNWSPERYSDEIERLRASLSGLSGEHWRQFLSAWSPS